MIFFMCSFLLYRAGLYGVEEARSLKVCARRLMIKEAELQGQYQGADQALVLLRIEAP
jgi:hypothetical protein